MEKPFLNYYERKYNESIKNLVYVETPFTNKAFHALVEQQQSDYVLAGNLSDLQLLMIKKNIPIYYIAKNVLQRKFSCFRTSFAATN